MVRLLENLEDGYATIEVRAKKKLRKSPATIENIKGAIQKSSGVFELLSKMC